MSCIDTLSFPDSKVHGANMGPTWDLSAPDGPHVGPMNLATRVVSTRNELVYLIMVIIDNWHELHVEWWPIQSHINSNKDASIKHEAWQIYLFYRIGALQYDGYLHPQWYVNVHICNNHASSIQLNVAFQERPFPLQFVAVLLRAWHWQMMQ